VEFAGTMAPWDQAANKSAQTTANQRLRRQHSLEHQRKAVVLQNVVSSSGYWALIPRPRVAPDQTGSGLAVIFIRLPVIGGSAHPPSVSQQAKETAVWFVVATNDWQAHKGVADRATPVKLPVYSGVVTQPAMWSGLRWLRQICRMMQVGLAIFTPLH
jgi:hypothetical protein